MARVHPPLGLRLGNVTLKPGLTSSVGYDTNPQRTAGTNRTGSAFRRLEGDLDVQSDWNVHELKGKLLRGYSRVFRDEIA